MRARPDFEMAGFAKVCGWVTYKSPIASVKFGLRYRIVHENDDGAELGDALTNRVRST
jgi:hypothetical protein